MLDVLVPRQIICAMAAESPTCSCHSNKIFGRKKGHDVVDEFGREVEQVS